MGGRPLAPPRFGAVLAACPGTCVQLPPLSRLRTDAMLLLLMLRWGPVPLRLELRLEGWPLHDTPVPFPAAAASATRTCRGCATL